MKIRIDALKAVLYAFAADSLLPCLPDIGQYFGMLVLPRLIDAKVGSFLETLDRAGLLDLLLDAAGEIDASALLDRLGKTGKDRFTVTLAGREFTFTDDNVREILQRASAMSDELRKASPQPAAPAGEARQ